MRKYLYLLAFLLLIPAIYVYATDGVSTVEHPAKVNSVATPDKVCGVSGLAASGFTYLFQSNWDAASGATDEVCAGGCPGTWDSLTDTQSDASVDDTVYRGGSGKSFKIEDDNTDTCNLIYNKGSDYGEVYVIFYINFDDVATVTANASYYPLLLEETDGTDAVRLRFRNNSSGDGVDRLYGQYWDDSEVQQDNGAQGITVADDTFYKVKVRFKPATGEGNDDGILQVWFDGTLEVDIQNADTDECPGIGKWLLGRRNSGGNSGWDNFWYDDFDVSETDPDA